MHMKRTLSLLLAGAMMLSLAACGGPTATPSESNAPKLYTAGTYKAEATGMNGPVKVEVTVSDSAITEVKVDAAGETPDIGIKAVDPMVTKIKDAQSAEVDAEAGATITSDAIKAAVQKCLDQALGKEVPAASGYTPGAYTATVKGHRGDVTVEVTVDEKAIKDVKVTDQKETFGIGYGMDTTPVEVLPAAIVASQSLAVDAVTGATVTSAAIKQAVAECVTKAGGDAEAVKSAPYTPVPTGAPSSYDVDVVVVGAGAAGLSAANAALKNGSNVLLLEKQDITGGSTARSGGKVVAADTPWMLADQDKDPQLLYDYFMETGDGLIDENLLKPFVFGSAENLEWLGSLGVEFKDVEAVHSNLPIWWVHNTEAGSGMTDGHGGLITVPMTAAYEKAGGKILYGCAAETLIVDAAGAVTGVNAVTSGGGKITVNAKSVILTTGGYAQNREMMARIPGDTGYYSSAGTGNTGDGLVMAQAVGAKVFDSASAAPVFIDFTCGVGGGEMGGLMVSYKGERIVNEYTYQFHTGLAIEQTGTPYGYYIATANDPNQAVQYGMTLETTAKASSLAELAELTGMDTATLEATVERYNELCAKGVDDDFGKRADHLWPVEGETYYAFKMSPAVSFTLGGLCIDPEARVLDENNQPIPGLYAAGEVAFSGLIGEDYPSCGTAIGVAAYYGRVAANTATAQ